MTDPFEPFALWLSWLDSHDGRLHRRRTGGQETDTDLLCVIPTPPGGTIFTVGDLRSLVALRHPAERPGIAMGSPPPWQKPLSKEEFIQILTGTGWSKVVAEEEWEDWSGPDGTTPVYLFDLRW